LTTRACFDQARTLERFKGVQIVGVDKTSLHRGQHYITLVHDLDVKRLRATDGRDHQTVLDFAAELRAHGGDAVEVRHVCMDRSAAYVDGAGMALPQADISCAGDGRRAARGTANRAPGGGRSAAGRGPQEPALGIVPPIRRLYKTSPLLCFWCERVLDLCAGNSSNGGELMFRLITSISAGELFRRQLPVFLVAFLIAELFYKFHSFTLECAAFLATWFVLDGALHLLAVPPSQDGFHR